MGKSNGNIGPKDLKKRYATLSRENQNLRHQVEVLTSQLAEIQRMIFGRKSEKVSSDQLALFAGNTDEASPSVENEDEDSASDIVDPAPESGQKKRKPHPGRYPLSPELERQDVHLHPDNLDCSCCGATMKPAGVEISEKLASRSRFYVERINLHKYACRNCEESIVRPDMPPAAIDKCLAKSDVLAGVIVAKYQDSLPLYRQEAMFRREGVTITRQTMCGWMEKCAFNLRPIVEHMGNEILAGSVIQSDDTGLKYLKSPGPAGQGYMWSYVGGDQAVVYDFTTDRARAGPAAFLSGFCGTLQVDGYAGYNLAQKTGGLNRAACWAHVRRKFEQSLQTEKAKAAAVLLLIQKLYGVERRMRQHSPTLGVEQIARIRKRESLPVIKELKEYLLECRQAVLPKSPLGKAIEYAFGQWEWLVTYIHNGLVDIDNNSCERSMRKVAIGRKNYMFVGSEAGGRTAAIFYSLLETCLRLGINPVEYLTDVLVLVNTHPQSRIAELTPHGWAAIKNSEEKLSA